MVDALTEQDFTKDWREYKTLGQSSHVKKAISQIKRQLQSLKEMSRQLKELKKSGSTASQAYTDNLKS